jgi:hypothetical protein
MGRKNPKWSYIEGGWLRRLWLAVLLQAQEDALNPVTLDKPMGINGSWTVRQRNKASGIAYILGRSGSFDWACDCAGVEAEAIIKNFRLKSESHPPRKIHKRWESGSILGGVVVSGFYFAEID